MVGEPVTYILAEGPNAGQERVALIVRESPDGDTLRVFTCPDDFPNIAPDSVPCVISQRNDDGSKGGQGTHRGSRPAPSVAGPVITDGALPPAQ